MMTRYPKNGKGAKWTIAELKSIQAEWKGDTISDSEGLSGEVRVSSSGSISIRFKYAYRWNDKVAWFSCGTYPANDLVAIRNDRDAARSLVKDGVDPKAKKTAVRISKQAAVEAVIAEDKQKRADDLSFQDLYDIWIKDGVNRTDKNKYIIQTFNKHALPALAKISIKNLTEHDLREFYRKMIATGIVATAVELSKDIGQMLRWAEKRKPWRALLIDGNPSELVEIKKLVPKGYTKERKRMLSIDELKKLKSIFDITALSYAEEPNKRIAVRPLLKESQLALWITLSTLSRIGELLMTEWKHVNFDKRTWFIPAANVKGEDGDKRDQLVYLSEFSFDKFKQLHTLTGQGLWAFPASNKSKVLITHVCLKSVSKQVGDRQVKFKKRTKTLTKRVSNDTLVLGDVEWTPHDLRRTGATMMQQLKVPRDVINLCQNHVIGSKVDRVYLLDDYADEKRDAWHNLGNRLNKIFSTHCS